MQFGHSRCYLMIGERSCADISSRSFPTSPPLVQFFGVVDTNKLVLADNPEVGLDETTRNCSAIFLTWPKFLDLESGKNPEPGWYANYVYGMLPRTKPHLTKKCEDLKANTTPFRKPGRKAYARGYMHGFCSKTSMFSQDARPSSVAWTSCIL
jgi:hypothetical protein